MIRKKLCIFTCLLLFTTGAFAQRWTDLKQVLSVQVMNDGGFMLNIEGGDKDNAICSETGKSTILFYPNQNGVSFDGAKSLLSIALIAFSTGNKVNVMYSYSLDSGYCWGRALLISK